MYDIIGDIHGQANELIKLLEKMDYRLQNGVYSHPQRKVIFLGDFIDRGKQQLKVIDLVRPMIEQGHALAVMGNHEYNAVCFNTEDPQNPGKWLRPRSNKNISQHVEFLNECKAHKNKKRLEEDIAWFKTLPLWLDLGDVRIVHACWDEKAMDNIRNTLGNIPILNDKLWVKSATKGHWAFEAIETILKGKEVPLPNGSSFKDKDGTHRHHIRVKWWDKHASTYKEAYMGPDDGLSHIPEEPISGDFMINYQEDFPPVFLGHYWMEGKPACLTKNIACVDFSVARSGGKLVAYRWDGEIVLNDQHFISIARN